MSDKTDAANRSFVGRLFSGRSDGANLAAAGALAAAAGAQEKQRAAAEAKHDSERDEFRRFVAALFAPDDHDAEILPGLTDGRSVGRWQHTDRAPEDRGPWFERR